MDAYGDVAMPSEKPTFIILEHLTGEIDRYERILHQMEQVLAPVLVPDERGDTAKPQEALVNDYHRLAYRLQTMNDRAADLQSRIRV